MNPHRLLFTAVAVFLALPELSIAQLPSYDIQMSPALYDTLFVRDIWSEVYLPTQSLNYEGAVRTDAQIRFKGHSTRYFPKKPYRLKFSANFQELRQLNLNSMYTDKSFIRESFCWLLYRDIGALVPAASHATLTLNGSYKGVFLQVEKVDKYFIQKHGRTPGPTYQADDVYISGDLTVQPDSVLRMYYTKEVGDANDYSDLVQLIAVLNSAGTERFPQVMDSLFDQRSVLDWFAVNTLVMGGDSYNKNYYVYRDTSRSVSQWTIIPWDYDLSLGRTGDVATPYPASIVNDLFAYTFPPLEGPSNVLKQRFMDSPVLMERFRSYLDSLLTNVWTEAMLHSRIDSLSAYVDAYIADDPAKWGTYDDFLEHGDALKYFVTARRNYLISTFLHPVGGEYDMVMIRPTQLGIPYHCLAIDGRQVATLTFNSIDGLDSILVRAYPDSIPPNLEVTPTRGHIRRWLQITPYPSTAQFSASLQWMWMQYDQSRSEVSAGVQNERLLRCHVYRNGDYAEMASHVNAFGNFVSVDRITQEDCGPGNHFAVLMPATYTQKWYRHPSYFWQRWYGIANGKGGRMAVVGDHGTAITSVDSGQTWTERAIGANLPFFDIETLGTDTLLAAGEYGSIYRSIDYGSTWSRIPIGSRSNFFSLDESEDGSLWAGGEGAILKSSDRGSTWAMVYADSTVVIRNILGFSSSFAIGATDSGHILATSDGGLNWSRVWNGSGGAFRAIGTFHGRTCLAVGDSGNIIASSDSGRTWGKKQSPVSANWRSVSFVDSLRLYIAGENGMIFFSQDGGTNWFRQYTADAHDLNALSFSDGSHGIAVGNGGTILMTSTSGTVTGVEEETPAIPLAFALRQNFPNPFNPATTISFHLPTAADVRIVVFDILGRHIATPLDEMRTAGNHEVVFNASRISSGVYFYRLTAGPFMQTRKMLVLR